MCVCVYNIKLAYARAITCHVNCFPSIHSVVEIALHCIAFTLNALFNSVVLENDCFGFKMSAKISGLTGHLFRFMSDLVFVVYVLTSIVGRI